MTITSLLLRFAVTYVGLLVALAIGLSLVGVKGNSGVNVAALLGAVTWVCHSFAKKNQRYFTPAEKSRAVWGMWGIDVALQAVITVVMGAATLKSMTFGPLVLALAFVALVHAVVIYVFVGLSGKQYAKQVAKSGASSR